jgi:solute carrier family 25 folate transporter 32
MHPLENIKLRFQAVDHAQNNPIPPYRGIVDAISTMYRQEGLMSLYRGVLINVLAGSMANSIFFYVYTEGKERYGFDQNNP